MFSGLGSSSLNLDLSGLFNALIGSVGKAFKFLRSRYSSYYKDKLSFVGNGLENLWNGFTGSDLTDSQVKEMDIQLANQRLLNQEEYDRKVDFYNRFESPSAMVSQYQAAGLNPMLLAGGAHAGASASGGIGSPGSAAGASSPFAGNGLAALLEMATNYALKSKQLEIEGNRVDIERGHLDNETSRTNAEVAGQNIENANLQEMFDLRKLNLKADTSRILEQVNTEPVRRALYASNISVNEAETAIKKNIDVLQKIDIKYHEDFKRLQLQNANLQNQILEAKSEFERNILRGQVKLINAQVEMLGAQFKGQQIENGILGKQFLYYDKDRKFNRWTTGIGTAFQGLTAISAVAGGLGFLKKAFSPAAAAQPPSGLYGPSSFNVGSDGSVGSTWRGI